MSDRGSADRQENAVPETDGGFETGFLPVDPGHERGGIGRTLSIAAIEYRLAVRSRWALALTGLFLAFSLALATFSGASVAPQGYERVVASLAALAVYLVPLAALAFGYDAIVGSEESGWLHALFALPVARSRVVIGTYLGRAVVLASAIVVGFGVSGLLLLREFGVAGWPTYLWFTLASVGVALAFLSIAVFVSTIAAEKAHALGLSLLAWAWFVLVHDLLSLGVIAAFALPDRAVTAMVLANPTGVFRVLVLSQLETAGTGGFTAILAATDLSVGLLAAALLAWIVVPLVAAAALVRRRTL